jgi:UDPglucose--hexose-1-phosphate uridylyltransferase
MSELRWNPLLKTWTMVASHRQNRPDMPKDWCPFCPGSGKVPDQYDVYKYDNDFPAISQNPNEPDIAGTEFYNVAHAYGKCEVILYSSEHTKTMHSLSISHIKKLIDLIAERVSEMAKLPTTQYVMPFENKGEEVGVTMPHPHGQIYAYSWIPLKVKTELDSAKEYYQKTGKCIICKINEEETGFKKRIIFTNDSFIAYIPFFTDYPFGVFISSKKHIGMLYDFNDIERNDLAQVLKVITGSFDKIFDRPFPYMMVMHQNPVNTIDYEDSKDYYHFHIEFYPPLRGKNAIKYYASSEMGGWAAANVASVENTATQMKSAMLDYLATIDVSLMKESFTKEFINHYGCSDNAVNIYSAPARINLIGEHIDYNGGRVLPVAINKYLYLAIRKRNDDKIVYNNLYFSGEFTASIKDEFKYIKENDYTNYLNGILKIMSEKGSKINFGFDVLIFSQIPTGGGVSSSAALELGFAYAINDVFSLGYNKIQLAQISQSAEHEFIGVKCGIMDQFSVAMGKKGNAILLNTANLEYQHVPLSLGDYRIIVMNSNKKRALSDSKYNERLEQCRKGLTELKKYMDIIHLCDAPSSAYEKYKDKITDPVIRKRVKHVISENERVNRSVIALQKNDLIAFGALMRESHISLRDDYEVTGIELDTLFEEAWKLEGCIGARMTGAGFGGCAIAVVHKDKVKEFIAKIETEYTKKTNLQALFFECESGDGVEKI